MKVKVMDILRIMPMLLNLCLKSIEPAVFGDLYLSGFPKLGSKFSGEVFVVMFIYYSYILVCPVRRLYEQTQQWQKRKASHGHHKGGVFELMTDP